MNKRRTRLRRSSRGENDRQLMFSLINTGRAVEQSLEEALVRVGLSLAKFGALTHLVEAGEPLNFFIYPYVEVDGKAWPAENVKLEVSYKDE